MEMAMKGQFDKLKFDEFSLVILGGVIFLGILVLSFTTPSEFPPKVAPLAVTLNLDPGSYETFNINVSGKITGVNVSATGEIANWMQISKTDLGILKEKEVVPVTISVPGIASAGTHRGKIVVLSKEGRAEVDVTVIVSAVKRLASRSIPIGDFKVSYQTGVKTLDSHGETFVSKSYLYEKPLNLVGVVEDDVLPILTGGSVRFVVEDSNNYGAVVVSQNGRDIFSEVVGPGEVVVPLNISDVGGSNAITIRADNPGIFFWAENVYGIRDVSLDIAYSGSIPKTFDFALVPDEYRKFDHLQLTYSVTDNTPQLPPMKITLNGQTVYFDTPPTTSFNQNFERDVFGGIIGVNERNTMTFSFNQEASYEISGATLTVFNRAS